MARQPRLVVPDIALHIVQRGVDRKDCFQEDTDRLVYLTLLRDCSAATGCSIHAYCLMTNHVHLLLTPRAANAPAKLMYGIGQRYVPYFNRRYGRTGTLWEGRFKSCLVASARYVLGCYRYIELNPVQARMVTAPASYPWSSYRGNAGMAANALLRPHPEYEALGNEAASRSGAYRALFDRAPEANVLNAIRAATVGGYPLVDAELKARLALETKRSLQPGKPGRRSIAAPELDPVTPDFGL
jgi:putative transposase